MTISNRFRASRIRFLITFIFFAIGVTILYPFLESGVIVFYTSTSLMFLFIIIYLIILLFRFNFIHFSDDGAKFIFRYYFVHPFLKNLKAIEIPKKALKSFHIKKSLLGLKKEIILVQKTKKGLATFPTLSISLLSEKDRQRIQKSLMKQIIINKSQTQKKYNKF